mgnify:CR=1 FL=1
MPLSGASRAVIQAEEAAIGHPLSAAYRSVLSRWNGLDLEVIRLFGCKDGVTERLQRMQTPVLAERHLICFGSDPAGFLYCEKRSGSVFSLDTKGGQLRELAGGFDDFMERIVFGRDADQFSGREWLDELRRAGLV